MLDGATYSCGTGVGVECCLPAPADGGGAGPFACGPAVVCDGRVQVCKIIEGGAHPVDGGAHNTYGCEAIPSTCVNDVTCACIASGAAQTCSESDGDVTVMLALAP